MSEEKVVPLPGPDIVLLEPPSDAEVRVMVGAFSTACAPAGGLTEVQRAVIHAISESMTGVAVAIEDTVPVTAGEFAEAMRVRDAAFRTRMVQMMLLGELLLVPLPPEVAARVEDYAYRLGVADDMMAVARRVANGSLGLALIDFERSGYFTRMLDTPPEHLHTRKRLEDAWELAVDEPDLYQQWTALEHCPEESLGRGVWKFYRARGFTFPGRPNSAPPTLAQHDWIHVLADYGSTVESEIEVFGLIARANDDPHAFSLLAMVLGLFETGYLYGAAKGFFGYDRGHLSRDAQRMAARLADAMYRGAKLAWHLDDNGRADQTDLLATDWFEHADRQLDDVRAEFGLLPNSPRAIAAGSVSPWEPGGISPFQHEQGRRVAEAEARPYESYGASPLDTGVEP
jgi:hypothetical protein